MTIRITVRAEEVDSFGHVNGAEYLRYADRVCWQVLFAAGITEQALLEHGVVPIRLEETVRYHRELRAGDEVDADTTMSWGVGKTFRRRVELRRGDGTLVAEIECLGGMFDLGARKLTADPVGQLRALATNPEVLGLEEQVHS